MTVTQHIRKRGMMASVRADASNPQALITALNGAFEEFKASHTADLKKHDSLLTEKTDRINADISTMQAELHRITASVAGLTVGGAGATNDPAVAEHAKAMNQYLRRGVEAGLGDLQIKARLSSNSDPDGGYLIPEQIEQGVDRIQGTMSAMRGLANVVTISEGDSYKILNNQGGAGTGWVGETESRPETNTPTLKEITVTLGEIYANPAITQRLLDDARFDVAAWLADEVGIAFAEQEGAAFISGDGINKPRGITQYTWVANASYAWGSIGYIVTGASGAFASATTSVSPADALISQYYALKAGYRNDASWLMSDATQAEVRKIKDVDGKFVWAPPSAVGEVATILQKPVVTDDNMPAIGANSYSIAFGAWRRAYQIVDKFGIRVLRDPFTAKPNVLFYTTKRVGGSIRNFEALKFLKFGSS
jgi:HK97 family phage major capsid protein